MGDPFENSFDQIGGENTLLPELTIIDIPIMVSPNIVETQELLIPKLLTPLELFPIISKELKQAVRDSMSCDLPEIPIITTESTVKSKFNTESLSLKEISIDPSAKRAEEIKESLPTIVPMTFSSVVSFDDL